MRNLSDKTKGKIVFILLLILLGIVGYIETLPY